MESPTIETRAQQRAKHLSSLLWHVGAFVIINAFFWILDLATAAGGLDWAHWITVFWGFALAFHALAYLIDGSRLETRKAREYLEEERENGAQHG